jgi:hypothetical protein
MAQTDAAQGIGQNIGHGRERHAQLIDLHGGRNARDLFDRAITARDVRTPLAGQQQVPTAEHVERQVAVPASTAIVGSLRSSS